MIVIVVPETSSSLKTQASIQGVYRKAEARKSAVESDSVEGKYERDRLRFTGLFADWHCSKPLLEFLDTTDTGWKI
jgi:hypothetical protein